MPRTDTHLWQPEMAVIECRHYAAYGWRAWTSSPSHWCYAGIGRGLPKNVPLPPPEYFCDNATHLAAIKREFTKRKTHHACFACLNSTTSRTWPWPESVPGEAD